MPKRLTANLLRMRQQRYRLLGSGGAYAVGRFLAWAIPTLPTRDPAAMTAIALALVAVALAACYLSARRATKCSDNKVI